LVVGGRKREILCPTHSPLRRRTINLESQLRVLLQKNFDGDQNKFCYIFWL